MFTVPGSPVCLLSSQSVGLAGLAPRLICSKRQTEPSGGLNGQPTEGFSPECLLLMLCANICWGLYSRAAPAAPFQCFFVCNGGEGRHFVSWGFCRELHFPWFPPWQGGGSQSIPVWKGTLLWGNFTLGEMQSKPEKKPRSRAWGSWRQEWKPRLLSEQKNGNTTLLSNKCLMRIELVLPSRSLFIFLVLKRILTSLFPSLPFGK